MTMKVMTAREARNGFGELMNAMQREPVFITKNNKPVGAFVSIEDLKGTYIAESFEEPSEEHQAYMKARVLKSLEDFKKNGSQGVTVEEARKLVRERLKK